jgi:hypothetical protein
VPRYFFHITDGQTFPDNIGTDLPGLAEARREARATFGDLFKNRLDWESDSWHVDIANEQGRTLATLTVLTKEAYDEAA